MIRWEGGGRDEGGLQWATVMSGLIAVPWGEGEWLWWNEGELIADWEMEACLGCVGG